MNALLKTHPAVFAVDTTYQILVPITRPSLVWVRIDGEDYYDESNGIMRSLSELHRVIVPKAALETAKAYTLCIRPLIERKPYFTTTEEVVELDYAFRPVPDEGPVRIFHISDAHNRVAEPIAAAQVYGDIDLLILNGDVINHSGDPTKFDVVYEICSALTGGELPVVFSRGNHDLRGNYAEKFADYTPNHLGHTYYTFRVGSIWGVLLDCGEDKGDWHEEYGHTVCCEAFRRRQTGFLREIIANASTEYAAEGVKTRFVIAHNPFTQKFGEPFDIAQDVFPVWCRLLRDEIKPDLMICGHTHTLEIREVGCPQDTYGMPCPMVIGGRPTKEEFFGAGITVDDAKFDVTFTSSLGHVHSTGEVTR